MHPRYEAFRHIYFLVADPTTPAETLIPFLCHPDPVVRSWIAIHPNTTVPMLELLAHDDNPHVRFCVSQVKW